jgi:hypothetical protein
VPALKLPNLFRRNGDRSTLKQRAADLKASFGHHASDTQPAPEPSERPTEAGDDAELLRLGAQFEVARAREIAACEACNAAQREADRHMPERPLSELCGRLGDDGELKAAYRGGCRSLPEPLSESDTPWRHLPTSSSFVSPRRSTIP